MLQWESNADETLSVNTAENIDTNEEGVCPLQIATQCVQHMATDNVKSNTTV